MGLNDRTDHMDEMSDVRHDAKKFKYVGMVELRPHVQLPFESLSNEAKLTVNSEEREFYRTF